MEVYKMATRIARLLSRGNGHTPEEVEEMLQRRNKDIEQGGFARAFGVLSYEKYEWLKKNRRLEDDER